MYKRQVLGGAIGAVAQNKAAHRIRDRIARLAVKPDPGQAHEVFAKGFQAHDFKASVNGLPVGGVSVIAPVYPQVHDGANASAALGVMPVSYTHLDVYKRQGFHCFLAHHGFG